MINYANNDVIVAPDGKWLDFVPPPTRYYVYTSAEHGTVTAQPNSGYTDDTVTLSNSADTGYRFSSYTYTGTGASLSGNTLTIGTSDVHVVGHFEEYVDPYNPLNLPPYTIRFKLLPGSGYPAYWDPRVESVTEVDRDNRIYDIYVPTANWDNLMYRQANLSEILGANSTGVTNMNTMFRDNDKLISVALFDTSSVTTMNGIFMDCPYLTSIPTYDTSNVTSMAGAFSNTGITETPDIDMSNVTDLSGAFAYCTSLETVGDLNTSKVTNMYQMFAGCTALYTVPELDTGKATSVNSMFDGCVNAYIYLYAAYVRMSSQATPPANHEHTFRDCGINMATGRDQLDRIPSDWK